MKVQAKEMGGFTGLQAESISCVDCVQCRTF